LGPLDRYTLGLVSSHARAVTAAYERFDFKDVFATSVAFNAVQLSAFLFEHAKDRLYAERAGSPSRRAVQSVLLHALVVFTKGLAPVAPHFAEEIYLHAPAQLKSYFHDAEAVADQRVPASQGEGDSLFLHGWMGPAGSEQWEDSSLAASVDAARRVRSHVTKLLERVRQAQKKADKNSASFTLGSFSEAEVSVELAADSALHRDLAEVLGEQELNMLFGTARASIVALKEPLTLPVASSSTEAGAGEAASADPSALFEDLVSETGSDGQAVGVRIRFAPARGSKCPRCRLFTTDATEEEPCCARCRAVLQELGAAKQ